MEKLKLGEMEGKFADLIWKKAPITTRELIKILPSSGKWPCYFSPTDTEGEKYFEEFLLHFLEKN